MATRVMFVFSHQFSHQSTSRRFSLLTVWRVRRLRY